MAECNRCKAYTECFENGVPICPSCAKELKGQGKSAIYTVPENDVSSSHIDEAVLSVTPQIGKKVALVISQVVKMLGNKLPEGEAGFDLVANRIEGLVQDGRLLSRGDVKSWHYSQVRKSK
jgi:hypothetical protein